MLAEMGSPIQWILTSLLVLSSLGVILARQPVHASLCFLLTLMTLAAFYLQLAAQFIAVMQILVYAGAILVIFMFVVILFQDAHEQIKQTKSQSNTWLLLIVAAAFVMGFLFLGKQFLGFTSPTAQLLENYGTVEALGELLYLDFFFPFEAVILLFLVAIIGSLYTARKEEI